MQEIFLNDKGNLEKLLRHCKTDKNTAQKFLRLLIEQDWEWQKRKTHKLKPLLYVSIAKNDSI